MGGEDPIQNEGFLFSCDVKLLWQRGFCWRINVVMNLILWVIKHEAHLNCVFKINGYLKGRFHHSCVVMNCLNEGLSYVSNIMQMKKCQTFK